MAKQKISFNALEKRASRGLALLFAIRMLGLFLLTPVFAAAARKLTGGDNVVMVGLALGIYGITQAIMQIPLGMASDRFGRRPVIAFGLILFILGGVICAISHSVTSVTIGRAIQGLGAVSAAIVAWIADATRPEVRTRAMAMMGASIGLAFAVSLILSPVALDVAGLSGLFWSITFLGVIALILALFVVPVVPQHNPAVADKRPGQVLKNYDLLRMNFSVFSLHFVLMALFVVTPRLLTQMEQMSAGQLWKFYLPVIGVAFILMIPVVIVVETRHLHKLGLLASIVLILLVTATMPASSKGYWGFMIAFMLFFIAFNVLEALMPSIVSRICPPEHKGLAIGFFNMSQSIGVAVGGALGGVVARHGNTEWVFLMAAFVCVLWFVVARGFKSVT